MAEHPGHAGQEARSKLRISDGDPIAAIATALSPAALGIVRTSGRDSLDLASRVFSRPKALLSARPNSLVHGWIVDKSGGGSPRRIDEAVLGVYRAPRSFTGEDMVEIFCHGGVAVVQAVLKALLRCGFRQAERGEFTARAYINGKTDLTRAEAVKEIIDSRTGKAGERAASRLSGDLFHRIERVKHHILDALGAIEVGLEYPEDEGNFSATFDTAALEKVKRALGELLSSWKTERLYQEGARVVLCGATNAGKSSLFNALLKEDRAIVSSAPGTTRDWLDSWADFDGVPVRLFDTAGLRDTADEAELAGVAKARELSGAADIALYVVDSVRGITDEDRAFIAAHKALPTVLVMNKCDLVRAQYPAARGAEAADNAPEAGTARDAPEVPRVNASAKTGEGLAELARLVKDMLLGAGSPESAAGAGLGSERQRDCVAEAYESVDHALTAAERGFGQDAVVLDLEDALGSLGEVVGDVCPDDVLENIFGRFCVGK